MFFTASTAADPAATAGLAATSTAAREMPSVFATVMLSVLHHVVQFAALSQEIAPTFSSNKFNRGACAQIGRKSPRAVSLWHIAKCCCTEKIDRNRGKAGMAEPAVGSTRSRLTQTRRQASATAAPE